LLTYAWRYSLEPVKTKGTLRLPSQPGPPGPTYSREEAAMRLPKWLRIKVLVEISIKVTGSLTITPHRIAWAILLLYWLLTHGLGNLPVHWAA
jgi:hypothetical protein